MDAFSAFSAICKITSFSDVDSPMLVKLYYTKDRGYGFYNNSSQLGNSKSSNDVILQVQV